MVSRCVIAAFVASVALCAQAHAQCTSCPGSGVIKVATGPLFGAETVVACHAPGDPIPIDVSSMSGDVVVHIYDCQATGAPQNAIGRVTVTGAASTLNSLRVLVAAPAQSWTESAIIRLDMGCTNFGGLLVADPDTLGKTRASIAVTGVVEHRGNPNDIDIHVGKVVRIQADSVGGAIDANIKAEGGSAVGFDNVSIAHVRAWHAIRGTIHAVHKDIDRVRVVGDPDGTPQPEGIQGDILSDEGSVVSVLTTGPIGTATNRVGIRALNGVWEVRTSSEQRVAAGAPPINADINAEIFAYLSPDGLPLCPTCEILGPGADGLINTIETGGNLDGAVRCWNMAAGETGARSGVFARGAIRAPIWVQFVGFDCSIIASSIEAPVHFGQYFKGSVVATRPEGRIDSVEVYGSDLQIAGYVNYPVALFAGSSCQPFNAFTPDDWFTHRPACELTLPPQREDSVIRAATIGSIRIGTMSIKYHNVYGNNPYAPRIETQHLGKFDLSSMREGVLWSGKLEYDGQGHPTDSDRTNDYTEIVTRFDVGCIGPGAEAWVTGADRYRVRSHVLGQLHLPMLWDSWRVWIGYALGKGEHPGPDSQDLMRPCNGSSSLAPPDGDSSVCGAFVPFRSENTPRCPTYAPLGNVDLTNSKGLRGEVMVNAENNAAANFLGIWSGQVVAVQAPPDPVAFLSMDNPVPADPLYTGPDYKRRSDYFGGGAVGLVPFRQYPTDIPFIKVYPIAGTDIYPADINQTQISQLSGSNSDGEFWICGAMLRFYGPVWSDAAQSELPGDLEVSWYMLAGPLDPPPDDDNEEHWMNMRGKFVAAYSHSPSDVRRVITLYGKPARSFDSRLPGGWYRVRDRVPSHIFCAGLPPGVNDHITIKSFTYFFRVMRDCDHDGRNDPTGTVCSGSGVDCIADVDDGSGTGHPDGGVTIDDLLYFIGLIDAGSIEADVDDGSGDGIRDHGVTIGTAEQPSGRGD